MLGSGLILLGISDLLAGRPSARRAVLALRAIAQPSFVGMVVGYSWEAARRSGPAAFAVVGGFGIAAIVCAVERENARRS